MRAIRLKCECPSVTGVTASARGSWNLPLYALLLLGRHVYVTHIWLRMNTGGSWCLTNGNRYSFDLPGFSICRDDSRDLNGLDDTEVNLICTSEKEVRTHPPSAADRSFHSRTGAITGQSIETASVHVVTFPAYSPAYVFDLNAGAIPSVCHDPCCMWRWRWSCRRSIGVDG